MMTKIEWRLRAVTRYLLTRYEVPAEQAPDGMSYGTQVQSAGEFDSLSLALRTGEAMAAHDRAHARDGTSDVVFDGLNLPGPRVRAKMTCHSAWPTRDSEGVTTGGGQVFLAAVYESGAADGGNAAIENRIFSRATPNATMQMQIDNSEAFQRFQHGDVFYVDFIPVPKPGELLPMGDD